MRKGFSSKTKLLKKFISTSLAVIMGLSVSLATVPQQVLAAANTTSGIHVSATKDGDSWSGANIILGSDSSQWPFSAGGPVAFTPEKDATYHLSFNVTSTNQNLSGFRVRWITGNENGGYTAGDAAAVGNSPLYAANEVATEIPAYFMNTISPGETVTYNVDFTMNGSENAGGLIGNLAIRGQSGSNDFYINWISIADQDDNELAYWPSNAEPGHDGSTPGLNWNEYPALQEVYKDYFLLGIMDSPSNSMSQEKRDLINYHYNAFTPGNSMKPENIQPSPGVFTFDAMDQIFGNIAADTYRIGHTLGWHSQTPAWMWGGNSYNITKEQALENIHTLAEAVFNRYGAGLYAMDVVNEAMGSSVNPDTWENMLRQEGWKSTPLGSSWVEEFFIASADIVDENGWDCKLYYNDFSLDSAVKAQAVFDMVKDINERYTGYRPNGKPLIEGIGMQGHYNGETVPANVEASIKLFKQLPGVAISVTELDIAYPTTGGVLTNMQAKSQGKKYAELFQIYKKYAAGPANSVEGNRVIERVTVDGVQDRIDGGWLSGTAPTLFGLDLLGKESMAAVVNPEKYLTDINTGPQVDFPRANAMYGSPEIGTNDPLWDEAASFNVDVQPFKEPSGMGNYPAATAKMKAMWDAGYLYVRAEVADDNLTQNSTQAHEKDSVEVFVSETGNKGSYKGNDNQYRVAYDGQKSIKSGSVTSFDAFAETIDGGYLVELKIPFKEIQPKNGANIGFDVQINDVDGTTRKVTVWSDLAANGYNSTQNWGTLRLLRPINGVHVFAMTNGNDWSGANIILGNDTNQWPWSEAADDGAVAFIPEKDTTYRLTFNATSTGTSGYRVRWIKDNTNGSYTADDGTYVNSYVYRADQVAEKIPAYFQNTTGDGTTQTYTVDFPMDGSAAAEGLIGNIAIRGQGGSSAFYINWIKIETMDGQTLVYWETAGTDKTDPEPDPDPEEDVINIHFNDADKALYENRFAENGGQAAIEWVHQSGIGHGDDYVLKGSHVGNDYTGANNAIRLTLPEPLQKGGVYRVSYWVYVPSADNGGKGTLTGPGFVLNGDYAGATGVSKFPSAPGTIALDQWKQVNVVLPKIEIAPINTLDFRFVTNDAPNHPDVWYIDDIAITLVDKSEVQDLVWDLSLPSLKEAYKDLFLFGNAIEVNSITNPEFSAMYNHHYNAVTPGNAMKPISISSAKGVYNYTGADQIVDWALANEIAVHGHTLLWHSQSPAWLNPEGTTRAEAKANLQEYINNVAGHFAGKVISWDVANEVFIDGGSGNWKNQIRSDATNGLWYRAYANGADTAKGESGADYLYDAFVFTRLADPNAVLYYNDYNEDYVAKSTAIAAMVVELNEQWENDPRNTEPGRLLIEGIGMQSHYGSGTSVAAVEASIQRFIATGAKLSVSELDATRYNNQPMLNQAEQEEQAQFFAQLFLVYTKYAAHIERVTIWGTEDRTSWRSAGHPTLFDEYYRAKEAFMAVIDPYNYLGITVPENPRVSGIVSLPDGTPAVGASVTIDDQTIETQSDGSFDFGRLSAGQYTIEVMLEGYDVYVDDITVSDSDVELVITLSAPVVPVKSIVISGSALVTLKKGQSITLAAVITPDNVTDKNVTWSISDAKVASIDADGLLKATAAGTAVVTVTASNGAQHSIVVRVTA